MVTATNVAGERGNRALFGLAPVLYRRFCKEEGHAD